MSGIKGLGVALRAVSGIVNHRGAQALQLLPRVGWGDGGAEAEVTSIQLVATSSATINPPSVLHLTSSDAPLPCHLPFP